MGRSQRIGVLVGVVIVAAGVIYGLLPVAPYESQGGNLQCRGALIEMWGDQVRASCAEALHGRGIASLGIVGLGAVVGAVVAWTLRAE